MRSTALRALMGALLIAVPVAAAPPETEHDEQTRAAMREIFEAIRTLLPLSLKDERFADPAERETILRALDRLAEGGSILEEHGRELDEGFSFLSSSLTQDVQDIRRRFRAGKTDQARFLLHELTRTCVACHSRLPNPPDSSLAERFVSQSEIAELPLDERVRLEVATRQFDRALDTYEELFRSTQLPAGALDREGHLDDYLELCIRVRGDFERAARALEAFAKRDDLDPSLRANAKAWIAALHTVPTIDPDAPPLARARTLLQIADDTARFPSDRMVLVHYFAASGLLNLYVAGRTDAGADVAEAYYLLGLIESRVGRSAWISQTESFLEAAIRAAPGAPVAEQAYALLEEFLVSGYTGSAGTNIPPEEMRRLGELRALIDAARAAQEANDVGRGPLPSGAAAPSQGGHGQ